MSKYLNVFAFFSSAAEMNSALEALREAAQPSAWGYFSGFQSVSTSLLGIGSRWSAETLWGWEATPRVWIDTGGGQVEVMLGADVRVGVGGRFVSPVRARMGRPGGIYTGFHAALEGAGVPQDEIRAYAEYVRNGGVVLMLQVEPDRVSSLNEILGSVPTATDAPADLAVFEENADFGPRFTYRPEEYIATGQSTGGGEPNALSTGSGSDQLVRGDEPEAGVPPPPDPPNEPEGPPPPRYLEARMPEQVQTGHVAHLEVWVTSKSKRALSSMLDDVLPASGGELLVLLHAPGFRIRGTEGPGRTILVPPKGDSRPVLYELEALREGAFDIEITAYFQGSFAGALTWQVTIDAAHKTSERRTFSSDDELHPPNEGEFTITIRYDQDRNRYFCQLIDDERALHEDEFPDTVRATPAAHVENLIRSLNARAKGLVGSSPRATLDFLKSRGIEIWNSLIPERLQRLFWERRDRIRNLVIVSKDDPIPWELMYPAYTSDMAGDYDAGFLAEQFPVVRWEPNRARVSEYRLSNTCFVLPEARNAPPNAELEVRALQSILNAGKIVRTYDEFTGALQDGEYDCWHFACHNTFDVQAGGSKITFGDLPFDPITLNSYPKALRNAPIVMMNACRSDGQSDSYTGMTGWRQKIISGGAAGFLGTSWMVRDRTAPEFARQFYTAARRETIGKALQTARESIKNEPGDPSWLAYTLSADPCARIRA